MYSVFSTEFLAKKSPKRIAQKWHAYVVFFFSSDLLRGKILYTRPPPPWKDPPRGGGCVYIYIYIYIKGRRIKFLPRGASKYTPPHPSPEKCLMARNGGRGGGAYIISPWICGTRKCKPAPNLGSTLLPSFCAGVFGKDSSVHNYHCLRYLITKLILPGHSPLSYYEAWNDYTNNSKTLLSCNKCVCAIGQLTLRQLMCV